MDDLIGFKSYYIVITYKHCVAILSLVANDVNNY